MADIQRLNSQGSDFTPLHQPVISEICQSDVEGNQDVNQYLLSPQTLVDQKRQQCLHTMAVKRFGLPAEAQLSTNYSLIDGAYRETRQLQEDSSALNLQVSTKRIESKIKRLAKKLDSKNLSPAREVKIKTHLLEIQNNVAVLNAKVKDFKDLIRSNAVLGETYFDILATLALRKTLKAGETLIVLRNKASFKRFERLSGKSTKFLFKAELFTKINDLSNSLAPELRKEPLFRNILIQDDELGNTMLDNMQNDALSLDQLTNTLTSLQQTIAAVWVSALAAPQETPVAELFSFIHTSLDGIDPKTASDLLHITKSLKGEAGYPVDIELLAEYSGTLVAAQMTVRMMKNKSLQKMTQIKDPTTRTMVGLASIESLIRASETPPSLINHPEVLLAAFIKQGVLDFASTPQIDIGEFVRSASSISRATQEGEIKTEAARQRILSSLKTSAGTLGTQKSLEIQERIQKAFVIEDQEEFLTQHMRQQKAQALAEGSYYNGCFEYNAADSSASECNAIVSTFEPTLDLLRYALEAPSSVAFGFARTVPPTIDDSNPNNIHRSLLNGKIETLTEQFEAEYNADYGHAKPALKVLLPKKKDYIKKKLVDYFIKHADDYSPHIVSAPPSDSSVRRVSRDDYNRVQAREAWIDYKENEKEHAEQAVESAYEIRPSFKKALDRLGSVAGFQELLTTLETAQESIQDVGEAALFYLQKHELYKLAKHVKSEDAYLGPIYLYPQAGISARFASKKVPYIESSSSSEDIHEATRDIQMRIKSITSAMAHDEFSNAVGLFTLSTVIIMISAGAGEIVAGQMLGLEAGSLGHFVANATTFSAVSQGLNAALLGDVPIDVGGVFKKLLGDYAIFGALRFSGAFGKITGYDAKAGMEILKKGTSMGELSARELRSVATVLGCYRSVGGALLDQSIKFSGSYALLHGASMGLGAVGLGEMPENFFNAESALTLGILHLKGITKQPGEPMIHRAAKVKYKNAGEMTTRSIFERVKPLVEGVMEGAKELSGGFGMPLMIWRPKKPNGNGKDTNVRTQLAEPRDIEPMMVRPQSEIQPERASGEQPAWEPQMFYKLPKGLVMIGPHPNFKRVNSEWHLFLDPAGHNSIIIGRNSSTEGLPENRVTVSVVDVKSANKISRDHVKIERVGEDLHTLRNLSGPEQVSVNGEFVPEGKDVILSQGDVIKLPAGVRFIFQGEGAVEAPKEPISEPQQNLITPAEHLQINQHNRQASDHLRAGHYHQALNEYSEADRLIKELRFRNPLLEGISLSGLARAHYKLGNYDLSIRYYKEAHSKVPEINVEHSIYKAQRARGDDVLSPTLAKMDPRELINYAKDLIQQRRYEEALHIVGHADKKRLGQARIFVLDITFDEHDVQSHLVRGWAHHKLRNLDRALEHNLEVVKFASQAVLDNPRNARMSELLSRGCYQLGRTYYRRGDLSQAILAFRKGLEVAGNRRIRQVLTEELNRIKQAQQAQEDPIHAFHGQIKGRSFALYTDRPSSFGSHPVIAAKVLHVYRTMAILEVPGGKPAGQHHQFRFGSKKPSFKEDDTVYLLQMVGGGIPSDSL